MMGLRSFFSPLYSLLLYLVIHPIESNKHDVFDLLNYIDEKCVNIEIYMIKIDFSNSLNIMFLHYILFILPDDPAG